MYYIMNQNNHIIAADDSLLSLLHIDNIDELSKKLILGEVHFELHHDDHIEIITSESRSKYTIKRSSLSSLLGELQLVYLEAVEHEQADISDLILSDNAVPETPIFETEETVAELPNLDDLILVKESPATEDETPEATLPSQDDLAITDESALLKEETIQSDALFDLTIPNAPQETIDEIATEDQAIDTIDTIGEEETPSTLEVVEAFDTTPIVIHIDEVSQSIGISPEDYKTFLDEYMDTAIALESELKSADNAQRHAAVSTLTQLADVLELPAVNEIITQLDNSSSEQHTQIVESFYATLSRLTTEYSEEQNKEPMLEETVLQEEMTLNEPEIPVQAEPETPSQSFGTLDLSDVKPIHFDFRLEEAANDLSLPVELIEEFVHDFIDQANSETKKMLTAYEEGDLDAIQKIGHLLKGASSNLRINALSDTLYAIQFCEDSSQLEDLIKRYWGHFLSFEQQIDVLSK